MLSIQKPWYLTVLFSNPLKNLLFIKKGRRKSQRTLYFSFSPLCVPCLIISPENMVRGLDEDETNFLDEVSRQQELIEKQRRE
jgi:hypothetical protein